MLVTARTSSQDALEAFRANPSKFDQVIGAANDFKEGGLTIGVGARDDATRKNLRELLEEEWKKRPTSKLPQTAAPLASGSRLG